MGELATSVSWFIIAGWVAFYFVSLSAIACYLMYDDKARSKTYQWRITEASLLFVAFIGGAFGAKIAQKQFSHKTRKEPFRTSLNKMVVWNFSVIGLVTYGLVSHTAFVEEAVGKVFAGKATERSGSVIVHRGLD